MKLSVVLAMACALIFFSPNVASAKDITDEIADLKAQIKALSEKIEELEEATEAVEELSERVEEIEDAPEPEQAPGLSFGGHLKIYLADRTDGESNGTSQNNNLSAGFSFFNFYISKPLNDWFFVDIQTQSRVFAAATPSIGSKISRSTSGTVSNKISEATATVLLPLDIMVRAGVFDPVFSEDYAKQMWWHEQYHGNRALINLQEWHDVGIEIYRTFEFESFSLPVSVYALNGDFKSTFPSPSFSYVDNNGGTTGLIHVAPEFFFGQLRILGSYGYGTWDDKDDKASIHYALGAAINYRSLGILSEYMHREWQDVELSDGSLADGERKGYYVRLQYKFTPEWRGVVRYSDVDMYRSAETMLSDNYKVLSVGVNWYMTDSATIMPQFIHVDGERSDGSADITYNRFTLGWRTTF
ncbi:MAG: porin [Desulfobacterales bacterium]